MVSGDSETLLPIHPNAVENWQQGDYTLSIRRIFWLTYDDTSGIKPDDDDVVGFAVVTQTCDILNRDYVTVCPLVELSEKDMTNVVSGSTPAFAVLQNPPTNRTVVDLGRMMTLHKSLLPHLDRQLGFTDENERTWFAQALARKHGRFAFPDAFNDTVLKPLRERILDSRSKRDSPHGKAYRSIRSARTAAYPNWNAEEVTVTFFFVLEPENLREAKRAEITKTLDAHFGKLNWPVGFRAAAPSYRLDDIEAFSALEWTNSAPIDWEFISFAGRILANSD